MTGCFCILHKLNTCGFNRNSVVERGQLLCRYHCRGNRLNGNRWILCQPTNNTSIGVSIASNHPFQQYLSCGDCSLPCVFLLKPQVYNLRWIQRQPVTQHHPSVRHTDEPQSGQNSCLQPFHLCWMTGEADPWLPTQ